MNEDLVESVWELVNDLLGDVSLEEISDKTGISSGELWRLRERKRKTLPHIETLARIAEARGRILMLELV